MHIYACLLSPVSCFLSPCSLFTSPESHLPSPISYLPSHISLLPIPTSRHLSTLFTPLLYEFDHQDGWDCLIARRMVSDHPPTFPSFIKRKSKLTKFFVIPLFIQFCAIELPFCLFELVQIQYSKSAHLWSWAWMRSIAMNGLPNSCFKKWP